MELRERIILGLLIEKYRKEEVNAELIKKIESEFEELKKGASPKATGMRSIRYKL